MGDADDISRRKRMLFMCLTSAEMEEPIEPRLHKLFPCRYIFSRPYEGGTLYALGLSGQVSVGRIDAFMTQLNVDLLEDYGIPLKKIGSYGVGKAKTFGAEDHVGDVHFEWIFAKKMKSSAKTVHPEVRTWTPAGGFGGKEQAGGKTKRAATGDGGGGKTKRAATGDGGMAGDESGGTVRTATGDDSEGMADDESGGTVQAATGDDSEGMAGDESVQAATGDGSIMDGNESGRVTRAAGEVKRAEIKEAQRAIKSDYDPGDLMVVKAQSDGKGGVTSRPDGEYVWKGTGWEKVSGEVNEARKMVKENLRVRASAVDTEVLDFKQDELMYKQNIRGYQQREEGYEKTLKQNSTDRVKFEGKIRNLEEKLQIRGVELGATVQELETANAKVKRLEDQVEGLLFQVGARDPADDVIIEALKEKLAEKHKQELLVFDSALVDAGVCLKKAQDELKSEIHANKLAKDKAAADYKLQEERTTGFRVSSNTHEKELGALKKSSAAVERGYEKKVAEKDTTIGELKKECSDMKKKMKTNEDYVNSFTKSRDGLKSQVEDHARTIKSLHVDNFELVTKLEGAETQRGYEIQRLEAENQVLKLKLGKAEEELRMLG